MDFGLRVAIAKSEDGADGVLKVFGWASRAVGEDGAPIVDHQGDIIPAEELEAAAYEFAKAAGPANVMHDGPDVGTVIESLVLTPEKREAMGLPASPGVGWWVGFEVRDQEVAKRVRSGELKEFSIEGTADRVPVVSA